MILIKDDFIVKVTYKYERYENVSHASHTKMVMFACHEKLPQYISTPHMYLTVSGC